MGNQYRQTNVPPHNPSQHPNSQPPHGQKYVPPPHTLYNNTLHQYQHPHNPPPQQYTTIIRQFDLIGFQLYPYPIDSSWRGLVPKFIGSSAITIEDHLRSFNDFIQDLDMQYQDINMRLFMMSLTEEAKDWFNSLPTTSIDSIQEF